MNMKSRLALLAVIAMLVAAWPAEAQQPGGRRMEREARGMPYEGKAGWRERQREREAAAQDEPPERRERMSPEERRQLRRDVMQHGREVYRGRHEERERQR